MAWKSQNDWVKGWLEGYLEPLCRCSERLRPSDVKNGRVRNAVAVDIREGLIVLVRKHIGRPVRNAPYEKCPDGVPDSYEPISLPDIAHLFNMSHTGVLHILRRVAVRKSQIDPQSTPNLPPIDGALRYLPHKSPTGRLPTV